MDYRSEFYLARYHIDIAKRMLVSFDEYGSKRFLIGVIREGAKAAGKLVRAFLIREGIKGNLDTFVRDVGPKYLDDDDILGIAGILNLERDQRMAKVEFLKGDSILLQVFGEWRVLRISRLKELVSILDSVIFGFSTDIKR